MFNIDLFLVTKALAVGLQIEIENALLVEVAKTLFEVQ